MFRYAQHDSNVIQSTTRVPVILSIAKDLKKRKKRYLTFVRYDTIRVPVILSEAKELKPLLVILSKAKNLNANHWKEMFRMLNMTDCNVIPNAKRRDLLIDKQNKIQTVFNGLHKSNK